MRQILCSIAIVLMLACMVHAASVSQEVNTNADAVNLLAADAGATSDVDTDSARVARQFGFYGPRPFYGGGFYRPRPYYGGFYPRPYYPRPFYPRPYYGGYGGFYG